MYMKHFCNFITWNGPPGTHKMKYSINSKILLFFDINQTSTKFRNRHHTAETVRNGALDDPSTIFLETSLTHKNARKLTFHVFLYFPAIENIYRKFI